MRKPLPTIQRQPAVPARKVQEAKCGNVFILILREEVVFPDGRPTTIAVAQETLQQVCEHCERHQTTNIGVIAMKAGRRWPGDVYGIGTFCKLVSPQPLVSRSTTSDPKVTETLLTFESLPKRKTDDALTPLVLEGTSRFKLVTWEQEKPYKIATVQLIEQKEVMGSILCGLQGA